MWYIENVKRTFILALLLAAPLWSAAYYLGAAETDKPEKAKESEQRQTVYYASKTSRVYHRLTCEYVDKIKKENLVSFTSKDEAEKAGKRGCLKCNP